MLSAEENDTPAFGEEETMKLLLLLLLFPLAVLIELLRISK